jgi:hypothetical protein
MAIPTHRRMGVFMNKERNTGAGWTVGSHNGRKNCGRWMEATDAEAAAALKAVKTVIETCIPKTAPTSGYASTTLASSRGLINTKADGMGTSLPTDHRQNPGELRLAVLGDRASPGT